MDTTLVFVLVVIGVALLFDFINGFHDAANAIATVVATRVLSPKLAVLWAALFNVSAMFIVGSGVAKTVGNGLIDLTYVNPGVILAGLLGAIVWNLLTWWWRIPSSSSHTLLGGYAGAAMAKAFTIGGLKTAGSAIILAGWIPTLLFIVVAPVLGLILSCLLMIATSWIFRNTDGPRAERWFRHAQLVSSAFMSIAHGGNDAQKTAGIITGILFTSKLIPSFDVPQGVMLAAYTSMGLGTLAGGHRIIKTMGRRLTHLKPQGGFCAEAAAAASIFLATYLKLPISTTHVITGAITGVGAIVRIKAVRWNVARRIVWAWIFTLPASAAFGWLAFTVLHFLMVDRM